MLWYFFVGVNFFVLATLIVRIQSLPSPAGAVATLSRHAVTGLVLLIVLLFYPLLFAYFHLYPVSKPGHLIITLLLWSATMQGALLCIGTRWFIRFQTSRISRTTRCWSLTALTMSVGLAYWSFNEEMSSGSLMSMWSLLLILGTGLAGALLWMNVLDMASGLITKGAQANKE